MVLSRSAVQILSMALLVPWGITAWITAQAQEPQRASSYEVLQRAHGLLRNRFGRASNPQMLDAWPYASAEGKRAVCGEVTYSHPASGSKTNKRFVAWGTDVLVDDDEGFADNYGARCLTRLPDDGSIAQAQSVQERYSPELGLKGLRIGALRSSFDTSKWTCQRGNYVADELCFIMGDQTVAGVPVKGFALMFFDERLHSIQSTLARSDYHTVRLALTEKLGSPTVKVGTYQNAMGATFSGETLTWSLKGGGFQLEERYELNESMLVVKSEQVEALAASRAKGRAVRGADDL